MQKRLKKALYVILALALVVVSAMSFGLVGFKNAAPAYAAGDAVVTATAPATVVKNGAEFSVNLSMHNTSGNSVFGLDFVLTYNKEAFTYVSGSIDMTLFAASFDMTQSEGGIKIAPEALPNATVSKPTYQFATVVFKVKDTATTGDHKFEITALSVGSMDADSGEIPSSAVNATVKVEEPSAAAELTSVVVKSGGTTADGTLSGTTYTVKNPVPYSAAVTITAVVSPKASLKIANQNAVSGQAKSVKLEVGANTIPIEITAENGTAKKTYSVIVTRSQGNTSTEIVGFVVKGADGADLSATVSGDIYTVPGKIAYANRDAIKLNITTAEKTSTLKIAGHNAASGTDAALSLKEGENRVQIVVQAETGASKTYTLVLTVEAPKTEYGLATLSVNSGDTQFELSPAFSSDVYTYVLRIPDNTETLSVTATTNDDSAEVVSGVGEYTKEQIEAGTILTVTVRAQSGETKSYQLVVVHTSSVKEGLSSLTVNGSKIDLVDGVYTYDIQVGKDVNLAELDFKTLFNEDVEVLGNTQLVAGNNTVILKVELKDGSHRYYTINISKEIENNNTLTYIMIGVAAALFVALVIALILAMRKKKKNNKNPDGGIHVNVTLPESTTKETLTTKEEVKETIVQKEPDKAATKEKEENPPKEESVAAVVPVKEEPKAEADANPVQFKAENLTQAYEALTREQKSFFDNLKKYALGQLGAVITTAKNHETIKVGKTPILKLQIKRGVTIASFMLENEQLKEFRMQAARKEGAQIKVKASEIAVCNLETYNTAVGMVDLMVKQCDKNL